MSDTHIGHLVKVWLLGVPTAQLLLPAYSVLGSQSLRSGPGKEGPTSPPGFQNPLKGGLCLLASVYQLTICAPQTPCPICTWGCAPAGLLAVLRGLLRSGHWELFQLASCASDITHQCVHACARSVTCWLPSAVFVNVPIMTLPTPSMHRNSPVHFPYEKTDFLC